MSIREIVFNEPGSGVTLAADVAAGATSLSYTGSDVFVVGDIIAIDNEWIIVGSVNAGNNTLGNLIRGKWTTAVSHSSGAVIARVVPLASYTLPSSVLSRITGAWSSALEALIFQINALRVETLRRNAETAEADEVAGVRSAVEVLTIAREAELQAGQNEFPEAI